MALDNNYIIPVTAARNGNVERERERKRERAQERHRMIVLRVLRVKAEHRPLSTF